MSAVTELENATGVYAIVQHRDGKDYVVGLIPDFDGKVAPFISVQKIVDALEGEYGDTGSFSWNLLDFKGAEDDKSRDI